jgi:hypothetical protein
MKKIRVTRKLTLNTEALRLLGTGKDEIRQVQAGWEGVRSAAVCVKNIQDEPT